MSILGGVIGGIGGFLVGGPGGAAAGYAIGSSLTSNNDGPDYNEQIKAYREQTELTREEIKKKQSSLDADKRRVEEKQIRALRNNYRPRGILSSQNGAAPASGVSDKLGQ